MSRFARLQPTQPLAPARAEEVATAEAALGTRFPTGYGDFITRYGRGILGGLVRIYTPGELLSGPRNLRDWRARIDEYWFWDASAALLTKKTALESVVIADTVGGDELIFHPDQPDRLFVLAHDFDDAYLASEMGLEAAVDWFFVAGILDEPFDDVSFEPY